MTESWAYYSAGVVEIPGDLSAKYLPNSLVYLIQGGSAKFFVITAVNLVSGNTQLTLNGGGIYALTAETITAHYYNADGTAPGLPLRFRPQVEVYSSDEKTALVDLDLFSLLDSAASFVLKKVTWANIKATLVAAVHSATSKATPVDADEIELIDSAASFGQKKLTWANLKSALSSSFNSLYAQLAGASGGQTICGGTAGGDDLIVTSTADATKGNVRLGSSVYDEVNNRLGIRCTPNVPMEVAGIIRASGTFADVSEQFSVGVRGKLTVSADMAANCYAVDAIPYLQVDSGKTNSGSFVAGRFYSLRNYIIAGDLGTLTNLYGQYVLYGHNNTDASSDPITTNAYGIYVRPYRRTGTIANMYDLYLAAENAGGTATNAWGIYQANAKLNYFAGAIYTVGNMSALSFTDRTPAFLGDALAVISQIKTTPDGDIDHSTLPEFAVNPYEDENHTWWPGRSIGDMTSVLTAGMQQMIVLMSEKNDEIQTLKTRLEVLEAKPGS